MDLDLNGGAL
jgi:hypothetical protein